jgi:outer membrane murein-binding lipoprotein Lpp
MPDQQDQETLRRLSKADGWRIREISFCKEPRKKDANIIALKSQDGDFQIESKFCSFNPEKRIAISRVLSPGQFYFQGRPDGDYVTAEDVEDMATSFMSALKNDETVMGSGIGVEHKIFADGNGNDLATPIYTWFDEDGTIQEALGVSKSQAVANAWLLGSKILSDPLLEAIKSGEITGMSAHFSRPASFANGPLAKLKEQVRSLTDKIDQFVSSKKSKQGGSDPMSEPNLVKELTIALTDAMDENRKSHIDPLKADVEALKSSIAELSEKLDGLSDTKQKSDETAEKAETIEEMVAKTNTAVSKLTEMVEKLSNSPASHLTPETDETKKSEKKDPGYHPGILPRSIQEALEAVGR